MELTNENANILATKYLKNVYGTIPEDLSVDDEVNAFLKGFEAGANILQSQSRSFKGGSFNITPRNWGKTTKCIEGLMKDPANSLLIVKDSKTKERLIATASFLHFYRDRIKTSVISGVYNGYRVKNVFIDDYDEFYAANSKRSLELILKNHGRCIYNSKSIPILIEYAEQHGYNIKHAENGGEQRILNYCVDGYDAENKIIIEFNERYHQNEKTKTKDLNRRRRILEHLGPGWKMIVIWYNKKIEIFKS